MSTQPNTTIIKLLISKLHHCTLTQEKSAIAQSLITASPDPVATHYWSIIEMFQETLETPQLDGTVFATTDYE